MCGGVCVEGWVEGGIAPGTKLSSEWSFWQMDVSTFSASPLQLTSSSAPQPPRKTARSVSRDESGSHVERESLLPGRTSFRRSHWTGPLPEKPGAHPAAASVK